jgi:hypothetical protein
MTETYLTPAQAAARLNMSPAALAQTRTRGTGPPFIRVSPQCIRYEAEALTDWMRARQFRSTSDYAPKATGVPTAPVAA